MPRDPYYSTPQWQALRQACLRRDGGICTVKGCGAKATQVDHITSRRAGGPDAMHNLRSLCLHHDAQIRELANGKRRRGGKATVKGCDANGWPLDPAHEWNRGR